MAPLAPRFAGALPRTLRGLVRTPLFTTVAVVTLAVGIGANAAIFSVLNAVLLKPLPFDDAERLVGVWNTAPGLAPGDVNLGPASYFTYREEGRAFEEVGVWDVTSVSVTGFAEPERLQALMVTEGTLAVLRVAPILGRRFAQADTLPRAPETVVLTYSYWQRHFGGEPDALGRRIVVDGRAREIIGVLPRGFRFLRYDPALLLPLQFDRAAVEIGDFSYQGVARLRQGVTLAQANADVARMIPLIVEKFPLPGGFTRKMFDEVRMGPNVRPLKHDLVGDVGRVLWVLLGAVAIVLLVACANVANLFLVRAEGRRQELAIRAALGADRGTLAGELLSESVTLGVLGGALGLGLAWAGVRLLVAIGPSNLPRLGEIAIDSTALLFTLAVSVASGLLFGLVPVVRHGGPRLLAALKEGGRLASEGRGRHRARSVLVAGQIAMALVLLVGSGLLIRTFQAMRLVEPGFVGPGEVLTLRLAIPADTVGDAVQTARAFEQIARRLEQLQGVESVGLSSSITMDGAASNDPVFVEEFPRADGQMPPLRRFKWISEGFFETMGRQLLAGRAISWADAYRFAPVVVVTENFAKEYWGDAAAAIGKRIRQSPANRWREIIGVVADERDDGLAQPAPAVVYWPLLGREMFSEDVFAYRSMAVAIRSHRLGSQGFLQEVQQAVWSVNPSLPLANVRTLDEILAGSMAQTSFALVMLAIAAGVALLLGVVGIYGVVAYVAAERTREIGIRMALGAAREDVSRLLVRHGLRMTVAGLLVGLLAAAGLTHLMSALLYGVGPVDPATFCGVAVLLGAIALAASYLPARRAARVDPVVALRGE